jgi:hypothetical protein
MGTALLKHDAVTVICHEENLINENLAGVETPRPGIPQA